MDVFWLLLPIVIGSVLFGVSLGAAAMKVLNNRSPVDQIVNRKHFGGV